MGTKITGASLGSERRQLIYITSPSYSGSTLLTLMLAMHARIATIGELKATSMGDMNLYQCSCGEKLLECDFWHKVASEMAARSQPFSLTNFGTHFRGEPHGSLCDLLLRANVRGSGVELGRKLGFSMLSHCAEKKAALIRQNEALIEVVSSFADVDYFLDGSKDPVRLKFFQESEIWDIKVIYIVRDGRGVANSYMRHDDFDMTRAANEWRKNCQEIRRVMSETPKKNTYFMHYEDFCSDTTGSMAKLYEFLALDSGQVDSAFNPAKHHIIGNNMRLKFTSEIRQDEKWRTALTDSDLTVFDKLAGDLNRSLGYS